MINIAVVAGFVFCFCHIPLPDVFDQLFGYLGNITSGLSMLVVGLSLSRITIKGVFADRKMFVLTAVRLLVIPFIVMGILHILPISLDPVMKAIVILTAALPASAAQTMIAEQYKANKTAASQAVFITTLFSVVTVPLVMVVGL